jgi:hypothetical protein
MRIGTFVVGVGACLSLVAVAATAPAQPADPIPGTWKVNVAKSKYSPGPAPKSSTVVITADAGGYKQVTDTVPATGAPTHAEVTWKMDGKDYPVKGNPNADTSAYTRVDARTYTVTSKKDGKPTLSTRVVIAADGKSRTSTQTGTDAQGNKVNNTIVYEKQ